MALVIDAYGKRIMPVKIDKTNTSTTQVQKSSTSAPSKTTRKRTRQARPTRYYIRAARPSKPSQTKTSTPKTTTSSSQIPSLEVLKRKLAYVLTGKGTDPAPHIIIDSISDKPQKGVDGKAAEPGAYYDPKLWKDYIWANYHYYKNGVKHTGTIWVPKSEVEKYTGTTITTTTITKADTVKQEVTKSTPPTQAKPTRAEIPDAGKPPRVTPPQARPTRAEIPEARPQEPTPTGINTALAIGVIAAGAALIYFMR
jgi:hypothetical protein